uniref:Uncharacterized protein n=1 Tax=Strongyloides venezuelensis TaxID=75913 RepID=A0A0K0FTI7_STRVS
MSENSGRNGKMPLDSQFPQYFTISDTERFQRIEKKEDNKQINTEKRTKHFQKIPVIQQGDNKTTKKINLFADLNREQETQHLKINNTIYHQLTGTQIKTNNSAKSYEKSSTKSENLYKTVFHYLAESDQLMAKKNEIINFAGNKLLEEALFLLSNDNSEELMKKFSKIHEKEFYSFIASCYMSLLPDKIRKKQGCLDMFIKVFLRYFMIINFPFDKSKISNIIRCRKRRYKKKGLVREYMETQDEINITTYFKKTFYYNEKINSTNNIYNVEKLEALINEIFGRAKLRQPIEGLSKINEKSNGLFVNIQDDTKTYVFAIGTTPIVQSKNLEVTIKNWLMFNLISPLFKMNEPHNRLCELLITITGGRGNCTTKERAGKCIHVDQLINDINNKGFETY